MRRVTAPRGELFCPPIRTMAYSHDYQISARRHLKAAETLYALNTAGAQPGAKAVAGYLYGLAGELAADMPHRFYLGERLAALLIRF